MGKFEPADSRDVTNTAHHPPGGETPTGAREDEARRLAGQPPADKSPGRQTGADRDAEGDRWHEAARKDETTGDE